MVRTRGTQSFELEGLADVPPIILTVLSRKYIVPPTPLLASL